jgi:short-subunit dehydrogenase
MAASSSAGRQHVLITGASSGIGRELAKIFAAEGFAPVLLARRRDPLQALALELKSAHGAKVTVLPADLAEPGAAQAVFDCLEQRGIAIDVLVNNAGLMDEGDFAGIELADHLRLLQVNIVALTALTRLFLAPMLARAQGRILNLSSIAAFAPSPSIAVYAASKAYVLSFGEALAAELQGTGVSVTTLCPGFTDTAMVRGSARGARLPRLLVSDAAAVARQGFDACLAGTPLLVAGTANALAAGSVRYLPRGLVRAVGGFVTRQWK